MVGMIDKGVVEAFNWMRGRFGWIKRSGIAKFEKWPLLTVDLD